MSEMLRFPIQEFKQVGWRGLVIIQGDLEWRLNTALQFTKDHFNLVNQNETGLYFLPADKLAQQADLLTKQTQETIVNSLKNHQQWLGQEFNFLLIDSNLGLNPDAIAALSGTIKAGGLLILSISDDICEDDVDIHRFLPWAETKNVTPYYFNQRLLKLSKQASCCLYYSQLKQHSQTHSRIHQQHKLAQLALPNTHWQPPTELNEAQINIINHISGSKTGHFVLTADRGRGKSATLGALAAQLSHQLMNVPITITAPAKNCIQTCQFWYDKKQGKPNHLNFIAPDLLVQQLNRAKSKHQLLIIDEAAALPAQILNQLAEHYYYIVYATTVHGYEGSGKGFSRKFIAKLKQDKRLTAEFHLEQAIRWGNSDPLEAWLNQVFLLNAEPTHSKALELDLSAKPNDNHFTWLTKAELFKSEDLLFQLFGLLTQAHYRTTPSDLRYILDSPAIQVAVRFANKTSCTISNPIIVAACLITKEGPLPNDLVNACLTGERRPKGHLTPQLLAAQAGRTELAQYSGWRVIRIAVLPERQKQQIGSQFISWLIEQSNKKSIDYISTSFATSLELLNFWDKNHFSLVRSGITAETNTGLFSSLFIHPINPQLTSVVTQLQQQNLKSINYAFSSHYKTLDSDIIWRWLQLNQNNLLHPPAPSNLVLGFANNSSNFFASQVFLAEFCQQQADQIFNSLTKSERDLLCRILLNQWEMKTVIDHFKLSGQKALIKKLRQIMHALLA